MLLRSCIASRVLTWHSRLLRAQHFLRKYRDAFRAVCCQHGATMERLDVLLQSMGAQPLLTRRAGVLAPGGAAQHAARTEEAERKAAAARRMPQWLRGLLSRLRSPDVEQCACAASLV